eukprot:9695974-Lingulodinium_polyedra.AAC.1
MNRETLGRVFLSMGNRRRSRALGTGRSRVPPARRAASPAGTSWRRWAAPSAPPSSPNGP